MTFFHDLDPLARVERPENRRECCGFANDAQSLPDIASRVKRRPLGEPCR